MSLARLLAAWPREPRDELASSRRPPAVPVVDPKGSLRNRGNAFVWARNLSQKATHPPSNKARWQSQARRTPGPFFLFFLWYRTKCLLVGGRRRLRRRPPCRLRGLRWTTPRTRDRDSVTPQRLCQPTRGQWPAAQKTITRDSSLRRRAINGVRSRYKRLLASAK